MITRKTLALAFLALGCAAGKPAANDSMEAAVKPVPIDRRPVENEYAWKGNPYAVDGWLKPAVTSIQFSCDDPLVAWFSDANGHAFFTR